MHIAQELVEGLMHLMRLHEQKSSAFILDHGICIAVQFSSVQFSGRESTTTAFETASDGCSFTEHLPMWCHRDFDMLVLEHRRQKAGGPTLDRTPTSGATAHHAWSVLGGVSRKLKRRWQLVQLVHRRSIEFVVGSDQGHQWIMRACHVRVVRLPGLDSPNNAKVEGANVWDACDQFVRSERELLLPADRRPYQDVKRTEDWWKEVLVMTCLKGERTHDIQ